MFNKSILFLLILLIVSLNANAQTIENTSPDKKHITPCPKIEKMDIFFISRFLVSQRWDTERKKVEISDYILDKSKIGELGPDTPEKLQKYWKKRGVMIVTNKKICQRIEGSLMDDNRLYKYVKDYRKVYFIVKDKYVIHYDPKDAMIDGASIPTVVLNKSFNIISIFKK